MFTKKYHEECRLIPSEHIGYGSIKRERKSEKRRTGLTGLFSYARATDCILMAAGTIFAVFQGACVPFLGYIFGTMMDVFLENEESKNSNVIDILEHKYQEMNQTGRTIYESPELVSFIERMEFHDADDNADEFMAKVQMYSLIYLTVGMICFVTSLSQVYFWEMAAERQILVLRKLFFSQILRQDITWFDTEKHGNFSSALSDDLDRVRDGIGYKFSMVIQYFSTFTSAFALGLILNWKLTCMLLVVGPFLIVSSSYTAKVNSDAASREQLKYSIASGIADEVFTCFKNVAAFCSTEKEAERYKGALNEGRKLAMKKYYFFSAAVFFVHLILYTSYAFGFWYGASLIAEKAATPGQVFGILFCMISSAFSIGSVLPYVNAVSIALGSSKTVLDVIDRVPEIDPYSKCGLKLLRPQGYIKFRNVSFSYPTRPEVKALCGVNFEISPGEIIALVGASGSGKSTIVNLLLRFYDPSEGEVSYDDIDLRDINLKWWRNQIGVVSQEPVLFGVSISENIRYGKDKVSLQDIINAAKLANAHSFIVGLPESYATLVGERGAQLSGGQKQRIAIARALIRNPKILLLDEATSAMDTQNEVVVQEAMMKAMEGRTTVIIAHRLSTIKKANKIFVFKEGEIIESGTHSELIQQKGAYCNFVALQTEEEPIEESTQAQVISPQKISEGNKFSKKGDISAEPKEKVLGLFQCVLRLAKLNMPECPWLCLGFLTCIVLGLVPPIFAFVYSEMLVIFRQSSPELIPSTIFWSLIIVALGAIFGAGLWLQIVAMSSAAEHLVARIRYLCFRNIIRQEMSFFDIEKFSFGHLITQLSRDVPIVKTAAGLRAGQIITSVVTLTAGFSIAFYFGWKLALILVFMSPVLIFSSYKQCSLIRRSQMKDIESLDQAGKIASECFQNLKTVQALAKEDLFTYNYANQLSEPYKRGLKLAGWFAFSHAFAQAVIFLIYTAAFWYGGYLINIKEMEINDLYRVFFAISFCTAYVGQSSAYLQDLAKGRVAAQSIFKLLDRKSLVDPLSDKGAKTSLRGKVQFQNVNFTYPSRLHVPILKGLNLKIECGQTLALVGPSGCGKSTIINLLERFYLPESGEILIDDINVEHFNLHCLRSQMSLVTQEPLLFDCSIKENITYGKSSPTSEFEVINAAQIANIHDFIHSLPQGYETICGKSGTKLSGGQKQRIAIARAIIRDPKILLLDEATSALDAESEKAVQQALEQARKGRTTIIVAHRLSTIKTADIIAVLHKGRIEEIGKHDELLKKQGIYYNLIKYQV